MLGQAQQEPQGQAGFDLAYELQHLGWIDVTALSVVGVFCILGLFKGLVWQASRILILVAGYVLAGRYGPALGAWIVPAPPADAAPAVAQEGTGSQETAVYLACVAIFLAVIVLLSLLATQLRKLVQRAGLGFFDRVCGGVFGVATGACVVLALLFVVNMFFRRTDIAHAAETSHALRLSRRAIESLGGNVPDPLRTVFALHPLRAGQPSDAATDPDKRGNAVDAQPPQPQPRR